MARGGMIRAGFGPGIAETARQLRLLDRSFQDEVRKETRTRILVPLVGSIRGAADTRRETRLATTLRPTAARIPTFAVGGYQRISGKGRGLGTMSDAFGGTEFGANREFTRVVRRRSTRRFRSEEEAVDAGRPWFTVDAATGRSSRRLEGLRHTQRQFGPWKGRTGYWVWPHIRDNWPDVMKQWTDIADEVFGRASGLGD